MSKRIMEPVDGDTAAAHVAYFLSDNSFIFPITPSSPMAEQVSDWSVQGRKNAFGQVTMVRQLQSEGGAIASLHGSISAGSLTTTFTSSQGLLLMIPNMYKIAGELLPTVIHVAARTVATEALSIFGDHSDVYATRSTGFAFLCASTVQECVHMAAAAHAATLDSEVPFVHFFDGFRTSHEVQKIDFPSDADLLAMVNPEHVKRFRARGLSCEHPVQRGTNQNPDVYFQANEVNQQYLARALPATEAALEKVNKIFGTNYKAFEYFGHPEAEDVIVSMGSSTHVVELTVAHMNAAGAKVGLVRVRLYRPFSAERFSAALPQSVRRICVLDRGRETHAAADPLHADVLAALSRAGRTVPVVVGGVYGLSSKDFNPDMALAVFRNLMSEKPKNRFTIGIEDDVSHNSLDFKEHIDVLPKGTRQCLLWGIGGDGTVGANKTAIKLIADHTNLHAQGYFAYDANKAGGLTVSHLRFGPTRFEAPWFVNDSDYVACHNFSYVHRFNLLASLRVGGTFVLNCPCRTVAELDNELPVKLRRDIANKKAEFYCIDATRIAKENGMGPFINMVLQSVFFALSRVLDVTEAVGLLKQSIKKMYARKGDEVVAKNVKSVDASLDPAALVRITYPESWATLADPAGPIPREGLLTVPDRLDKFNKDVFEPCLRFEGETIPVSHMPRGGELPTGTSQLGKRGIAENVPHWHSEKCVQCNQCSFVCPHAVIRSYQISEEEMKQAPPNFETIKSRKPGMRFRINVSALDCTGCSVCAETCPVKCLEMRPIREEFAANEEAIRFVREKVAPKPELGDRKTPIGIASYQPYLEFPGSCAGCGETPLVRLVTQMFGERMVIAAATGCNSIWGGSFPIVPYTVNARGEGPAWHNSLFEDGAELGYGMVSAYRQRRDGLLQRVKAVIEESAKDVAAVKGLTPELRALLVEWVAQFRDFEKTRELRDKIRPIAQTLRDADPRLMQLVEPGITELIARTSFWIIGGDGWAYDIDFHGLDHVLANNEDINILVLDTEVYSNTGGQRSKATPLGARAKFAVGGKDTAKKDLGRMMMTYETAYVASIAQGANMQQCMDALREAEAHVGPSIVIAYTPCMEHALVRGMKDMIKAQKLAVETGYWILYRFNPELAEQGKNPFTLDSKPPMKNPKEFLDMQGRFVALEREHPAEAKALHEVLTESLKTRYKRYQRLVQLYEPGDAVPTAAPAAAPAVAAAPAAAATPAAAAPAAAAAAPKPAAPKPLPEGKPLASPIGPISKEEAAALIERAEKLADEGKVVRVVKGVYWVGAVDYAVRDFHGIELSKGSSYNAYLILGESPVLVDSVKHPFAESLLASVRALLGGDLKKLRYVVCNHAEPDHASSLPYVLREAPWAEVVCTSKCRENLIRNFVDAHLDGAVSYQLAALQRLAGGAECWNYKLVRTGDKVVLGDGQTLTFLETPMVHWPESTMTYLIESQVLFTMDGFGQHLASRYRFDDELSEQQMSVVYELAKSYYANILMLYGRTIAACLGKLSNLPSAPKILATAHGLSFRKDTATIINLYKRWSQHKVLPKVLVMYDSMYGATERMARAIMQGVADYKDQKTGARAECTMLLARDASTTQGADEIIDSACFALGSSILNNEILPTVAKHVAYLKGLRPEGRSGVAFCSYGWNAGGLAFVTKALESVGVSVVDNIGAQFAPDSEVLAKCAAAGAKLAEIAIAKGTQY